MKAGRNDPCPCGSGRKYKQCCLAAEQAKPPLLRLLSNPGVKPAAAADEGPAAEWEVDLQPVPHSLARGPDARPAVLLVAAGDTPLHAEHVDCPPAEPEELAELLEDVLRRLAQRVGGLPEIVYVRHEEVAQALDDRLEADGTQVDWTTDLPAVEAAGRELRRSIGVAEEVPNATAPETWSGWHLPEPLIAALFRATAALFRAEPWRRFEATQFVTVAQPGGAAAALAMLGGTGDDPGVMYFADPEDLLRMLRREDESADPFEQVYEEVYSLLFNPGTEIPRRMHKEVTAAGWEVAGPEAYPMLLAFNTPGLGIRESAAHELVAVFGALARFLPQTPASRLDPASDDPPPAWEDPETGITLLVEDLERDLDGPAFESFWEAPEELGTALPDGPGAEPEAVLRSPEDPEILAAAEQEVVARFTRWLEREGLSTATVEKHAANAETFVGYLAHGPGAPVRSVTEYDLRIFLYDWYPRKVVDTRTRASAMPVSLRRFFDFLAAEQGVFCPWAEAVLAERDAYDARAEEFPGGLWWDPHVQEWRAALYDDLDARAFLPDRGLGEEDEWGTAMGLAEALLQAELQRRWLLWRDEVIRGGTTDPEQVRQELLARQRLWEATPHPEHHGSTPLEVIRAERTKT